MNVSKYLVSMEGAELNPTHYGTDVSTVGDYTSDIDLPEAVLSITQDTTQSNEGDGVQVDNLGAANAKAREVEAEEHPDAEAESKEVAKDFVPLTATLENYRNLLQNKMGTLDKESLNAVIIGLNVYRGQATKLGLESVSDQIGVSVENVLSYIDKQITLLKNN